MKITKDQAIAALAACKYENDNWPTEDSAAAVKNAEEMVDSFNKVSKMFAGVVVVASGEFAGKEIETKACRSIGAAKRYMNEKVASGVHLSQVRESDGIVVLKNFAVKAKGVFPV